MQNSIIISLHDSKSYFIDAGIRGKNNVTVWVDWFQN